MNIGSDNTTIQNIMTGTLSDLHEGQSLTVMGPQDANGNVTATSIIIQPQGQGPYNNGSNVMGSTTVGTQPVITQFSSNPSMINSGGTSTLSWNVTGANSVSIDQGIGQVNAAGTRVVSPATSTVYTISATNSAGTVTSSATIMVNTGGSSGTGTGTVWH